MGLVAKVCDGSGRATCKICRELIKKGQKQITLTGYRESGSLHNSPWDCDQEERGSDVAELITAVVNTSAPKTKVKK
jgi:hypothetical protein